MKACDVWLAREFLHRRAGVAAVWMSPTLLMEPSGRRLEPPEPCGCDPLDCPPLAPARPVEVAA